MSRARLTTSAHASRRSITLTLRKALFERLLDHDRRAQKVTTDTRQLVEALRGELHALVLEQPAYEFGTRVLGVFSAVGLAHGQQHARLDLDQQRGHQQIFGRQLEILGANLIDVRQILQRQRRHRDIEHVEMLLANQIEQQVERPFERLKKNLERIGRNVQIVGKPEQRLAIQPGECDVIDCIRRAAGRRRSTATSSLSNNSDAPAFNYFASLGGSFDP